LRRRGISDRGEFKRGDALDYLQAFTHYKGLEMKIKDEILSKIVLNNPVKTIEELENILKEKETLIGKIYGQSFSMIQIK